MYLRIIVYAVYAVICIFFALDFIKENCLNKLSLLWTYIIIHRQKLEAI